MRSRLFFRLDGLHFFQAACLMETKSLNDDFSKYHAAMDAGSSVSIFRDMCLLHGMKGVSKKLKLIANGGKLETDMTRTFRGLNVWCSSKSVANILSLSHAASRH